MGKKVTAADVARVAGVSPATVDRVLNSRGGVAKDKETKVLTAARSLGIDRALSMRAARTLRIAAFVQPPSNPYHQTLSRAFNDHNRGPNPYNLQTKVFFVRPEDPAAETIQRVAAGYDGVIVCLGQDPELASVLGHLAASGKPVMTLATRIEAEGVIHVGPDDYRAGRLAAELIGRFLGRADGKVLLMAGHLSMTGQSARCQGFADVLSERFAHCTLLEIRETRDQGTRAGAIIADVLRQHPDLAAVYNVSAGSVQAVQALKRLGRDQDIVFVTHELTPERRALLAEGALDAVIDQDPVQVVSVALEILADAFGRSAIPPRPAQTPTRLYLRESL